MKLKSSLRILYIHNANFDKESANRVQVINMCNSFIKNSRVSLLSLLTTGTSEKSIRRRYNLSKIVEIYIRKPVNNYYFRSFKLLLHFLRIKSKYNVIYTRDILVAYMIKMFSKKRYVCYEVHEIRESLLWKFMFRRISRSLDKIIAISYGLKNELDEKYKLKKDFIDVLPDGVDMDLFYVRNSKKETRDILDLPDNKKIILYIGSLQEWKGYRIFLEASNYFKDKKDILFVLVGGTEQMQSKLKKEFPNVYFKDNVKSYIVPYYLKTSDLLILPNSSKSKISTTYTSPLKLFEYMSSETPLISSNLPSIKEIVSEDEVLFVKPDSSKDLVDKIEYALENYKEMKSKAKKSYKKVQEYTWKNRVDRLIDIIRK